jgi:hypothetical protein
VLRSDRPPGYERRPRAGVLDPFRPEIHRSPKDDPKLPGVRVRELLEPLGRTVCKTVVDDYLREVRPLFALAGAGRAEQDDVLLAGEEVQLPEVQDDVAAERGLEGEVELLEGLARREPRGLDPGLPAVTVARVGLPGRQRRHHRVLFGEAIDRSRAQRLVGPIGDRRMPRGSTFERPRQTS